VDAETRAYLEQVLGAFREDVSREFGTLRQDFGTLREDFRALREDFGAVREDFGAVREDFGAVREDFGTVREDFGTLQQEFGTLRGEFGTLHQEFGTLKGEFGTVHGEFEALRQEVRDTAAETRRHFDVVAEYLRHDIRGIAEGVIVLSERVDRLDTGLRGEMNERFAASHAVVRVAFREVRRDIEDLRASL
jgi:predicted nuclease with TOPRIM domain